MLGVWLLLVLRGERVLSRDSALWLLLPAQFCYIIGR
jgi:hypothetical protein